MVRGPSSGDDLIVAPPPGTVVSVAGVRLPETEPPCLPVDPLVLLEITSSKRVPLDPSAAAQRPAPAASESVTSVSVTSRNNRSQPVANPQADHASWSPPEQHSPGADRTLDLPAAELAGLAVRHSPDAMVAVDVEGRVILWNPAAARLLGWSEAEVLGRPDPTRGVDDAWRHRDDVQRVLGGVPLPPRSARLRRRDGSDVVAPVTPVPLVDAASVLRGLLTVIGEAVGEEPFGGRDSLAGRQERSRARHAAVGSLGRRALHGADPESLMTDAVRTIGEVLDSPMVTLLQRRTDGRLDVLASRGWAVPASANPLPQHPRTPVAMALAAGMPVVLDDLREALPADQRDLLGEDDVRSGLAVPVGDPHHPWGVLTALFGAPGACADVEAVMFVQGVADVVAAAHARRRSEAEMRHRAWHDALTDLPNRDLFHERLTQALALGRRTGARTALLLLDLDGFKDVNDSQGHQAGDLVLRQVAHRLRTTAAAGLIELTGPLMLPAEDGQELLPPRLPLDDGVTVARLGGDEFAVIVADVDHSRGCLATATSAAEAVLAALREPFSSPGGTVSLGGSVGIVLAPDHGEDPYALLRRADLAMYRAKRERLGYAVHDPEIDEDAESRLWMVNDLRNALAAGAVTLAYQPVVDLGRHEVNSVEALARWWHPDRGPQSPSEFVALAEQSGLVAELTDLVLRGAVEQCARWMAQGRHLPVAVNLSAAVLGSVNYAAHLRSVLDAAGVPPYMIRVEVTESTLASDTAVSALREMGAMGVHVAIDDFGTGYSSLGRLKQLPVRIVKIDKSFVTGINGDRRDVAIVRSVVALAEELGLRVIAEGVETVDVARRLRQLGVHRAQGYLYSVPTTAEAIEEWHDNWLRGICPCCAPDAAPPLPLPPLLTDLSDDEYDHLDGVVHEVSWDAAG
ncbi:MAG: EAL domain-containing protein [Kineosporiaceae bacterium]